MDTMDLVSQVPVSQKQEWIEGMDVSMGLCPAESGAELTQEKTESTMKTTHFWTRFWNSGCDME